MFLKSKRLQRWTTGGKHGASVLGIVLGLGMISIGCQSTRTGFDSPAPTKRIDAIVEASGLEDHESLGRLIEQLESPDAVARMLAIAALDDRTGTTLGYEHAAPRWERIEAVNRWVDYYNEHKPAEYRGTEHSPSGPGPAD